MWSFWGILRPIFLCFLTRFFTLFGWYFEDVFHPIFSHFLSISLYWLHLHFLIKVMDIFSLLLAIFTNYMKCIHEFLCKKTCLNSIWRVFYLIFVMKIFEANSRCWYAVGIEYFVTILSPFGGVFYPFFEGQFALGNGFDFGWVIGAFFGWNGAWI